MILMPPAIMTIVNFGCSTQLLLDIQLSFLFSHLHLVLADFIVRNVARKQIVQLGDINMGVLVQISNFNFELNRCSDSLQYLPSIHQTLTLEFAIAKVNEARILPRNLTLGMVVLDTCRMTSHAVLQALTFVPQTPCINGTANRHYDVVGVMGIIRSPEAIAVTQLLSRVSIPLISVRASSDDLSDKKLYPYFLRTSTPDRFQFRAIFSVLKTQGWTYVSVVYEEGSYGENGFRQLRELFDKNQFMCFALSIKVHSLSNIEQKKADLIALSLVKVKQARIVILITQRETATRIIKSTCKQIPKHFIWVGTDEWGGNVADMNELGEMLWGSLIVTPQPIQVPDYNTYFRQLSPGRTKNPWFIEFWEKYFNCSYQLNTCSSNSGLFAYPAYLFSAEIIDTVSIFATAVGRVLEDCDLEPLVANARRCVTGPRLLRELRATSQLGYSGWIEMDSNGDRLAKLSVHQVMPDTGNKRKGEYKKVLVAEFDTLTETLQMVSNLSWTHHWLPPNTHSPESICSTLCGYHTARILGKLPCCWVCHKCRNNERLINNRTACETCPPYYWPAASTDKSTCEMLTIDYKLWNSASGITQIAFASLSLLCCLAVSIFFLYHRNHLVIRTSSRLLSSLMLLAVCIGNATIFMFHVMPNDDICRATFLFFCLSFTLLYGPLLIRTLSIYRIFESGRRSKVLPKLVRSEHQLLFSVGFAMAQVLVCVVVMVKFPQWHRLVQRNPMEAYVELTCDPPIFGLALSLAYNLLMVIICGCLAFKIRNLPNSFNESRFISMCVGTVLLSWIAFIPSYFLSPREHIKTDFLVLAVFFNDSVALVCLFCTKVYAVLYIKEQFLRRLSSTIYHVRKCSDASHTESQSPLPIAQPHTIPPPPENLLMKAFLRSHSVTSVPEAQMLPRYSTSTDIDVTKVPAILRRASIHVSTPSRQAPESKKTVL